MKIRYECSDLIEELEEDIDIYGQNVECYAYFKKLEGYTVLFDYSLVEEDGLFEMEDEKVAQIMKAKDVLAILKEQNRII